MLELDAILASGQTMIGTQEQPLGSNNVSAITDWLDTRRLLGSGYEGSAAAVSHCLSNGSVDDLYSVQFSNGADKADITADRYTNKNYFDENLQVGGLISFDKSASDTSIEHIDLSTGVNPDGAFKTNEGNLSDRVRESSNSSMDDAVGFAQPVYDDQVALSANFSATWAPYPGYYLYYVPGAVTYDFNVEIWQQRMAERGWNIDVDGLYGPQSEAVCIAFQDEKNLEYVDGIVGPETWEAAMRTDNVT